LKVTPPLNCFPLNITLGETPPADGILVYGEVSEDDVRFTGEEFVYRLVNRSKLDTTIRAQSQITSGR